MSSRKPLSGVFFISFGVLFVTNALKYDRPMFGIGGILVVGGLFIIVHGVRTMWAAR